MSRGIGETIRINVQKKFLVDSDLLSVFLNKTGSIFLSGDTLYGASDKTAL